MTDSGDPILERRAQVARWVGLGLRTGYGLFGLSMVLFVVALATDFPAVLGAALTFCLIAGSIVLAPAIVFSYAVKAADRADRDGSW